MHKEKVEDKIGGSDKKNEESDLKILNNTTQNAAKNPNFKKVEFLIKNWLENKKSKEKNKNQGTKTEGKFGTITKVKDGIITIINLNALKAGEIVWIPANQNKEKIYVRALVLNLNENDAQGILLGNERLVKEGSRVWRSGSLFKLKCSLNLFGQVLDGLGENKIARKKIKQEGSFLVEQKAMGIIDREPVRIPLRTGIKAVDSLIPIGRGQRELIIGDRQTGKTSVALDSILNHVTLNSQYKFKTKKSTLKDLRKIVWFIYNGIGQKQSTVNQLKETLIKANAFWFTSIVASTASESAPLQFLAPYTACTLGEFIRDIIGGHCTIIFDDLSKHAVAYRQMSLLLRRPPGREAFPGDVFYVHSRLLERAGSLTVTKKQVRGTLTAFPVIETQAGDVSAYIPTNVISITDGQIFLETELFYRGIRPAVNVGLSVSRVGSAAQPGIMKKTAGSLKMELAQFREIEGFSKLGASLDEQTQTLLNRGENIIEILKQNLHKPLTTIEQVLSIFTGVGYNGSWLNDIVKLKIKKNFGLNLINRLRFRRSWLEWFRSLSTDFTIREVSVFINNLLFFINKLGIIELNLFSKAENILLKMFKIHPVIFFDDLIVSFLREKSVITVQNTNDGLLINDNYSLYTVKFNLILSEKRMFNNSEVEDINFNNRDFSIKGLVLRALNSSLNLKNKSLIKKTILNWTYKTIFTNKENKKNYLLLKVLLNSINNLCVSGEKNIKKIQKLNYLRSNLNNSNQFMDNIRLLLGFKLKQNISFLSNAMFVPVVFCLSQIKG